jgi:mannose-6-phosphate isomerase
LPPCSNQATNLTISPTQDYKDDNHKPEMALALEDFEALCGFVSPAELRAALQEQPELKLCVGDEAAAALQAAADGDVKPVRGSGERGSCPGRVC